MRPYQRAILTSNAQDTVCISAPQLGKTETARLWLLRKAFEHGPDDRVWWWTAPTYQQVRHGFSGFIRYAQAVGLVDSYTTSTPLVCRLNFGVEVHALSWDNPQGMYGPTVLGLVADEFGWMTGSAYSAISSRRADTVAQGLGHALWIGNVGNIGTEAQHLWDLAVSGADGFESHRWTWRDRAAAHACTCGATNGYDISQLTTEDALATAGDHTGGCGRGIYVKFISSEQGRMSRAQFAQLYEAEWADFNDLPVYEFDRAVHVDATRAEYDPHLPVLLSCDFNVDPMAWTLGQKRGNEGWTFDEIIIPGGATTKAACSEFLRRHPDRKTEVVIYGDRSGKSRDTKSKTTDYDQIRQLLGAHYWNVRMEVPNANPPVAGRVSAVNAKLRAADGTVSLWIHPRCKTLIEDRARVSWKPGTRDIDKTDKRRTHASDADDYRWVSIFPVDAWQPHYTPAPAMRDDPILNMGY